MRPIQFVALVAIAFITATAHAQQQLSEVEPGSRIRFRAAPRFGGEVKGIVLERHGDSLKVSNGQGSPFQVTLPEIDHIAISRGKSRALGAGYGALWGAGIYAALGLTLVNSSCDECEYQVDAAKAMVAVTISGGFVGAMIGALVGRERWESLTRR